MFEIVRPHRLNSRELAQRLSNMSAQAAERESHIHAITGLVPQVMERTAALTLLQQALAHQVPEANARLSFIVDAAVLAMIETATER